MNRVEEKLENYLELWDWNSRFQRIMETLGSFGTSSSYNERVKANVDLINLFQVSLYIFFNLKDFLHAAKTYGKIILSEVCLPVEKKTIQPAILGGLAGGYILLLLIDLIFYREKYIVHNILFKLAVGSNHLFKGDDEVAAKVAGTLSSYSSIEYE